ncbi:MAG: hypothetical protein KA144_04050, partial [Xanthomonadaceae bacterium]|nr:hypothetical protein [Xanthomonadaceae bacterium]
MNERIALILGSALAAVIVAAPMVWLLGVTDSEGSSSLVEWKMHLRMTLPAMIAVALSAWWHSRGRRIADCPDGTL